MLKKTALIVAAGSGKRFGGECPKQFQELAGKPLICHTLARFEAAMQVDEIIVIVSGDWMGYVATEVVDLYDFKKVKRIVEGGRERQESVYNGLMQIENTDIVAVHDAARPLIATQKIDELIVECSKSRAVTPCVAPKDTIKVVDNSYIVKTLSRATLGCVQTPQVFEFKLLKQAHQTAKEKGVQVTDDSALVESMGVAVKVVAGDYSNIKVTEPADLIFAEMLIERGQVL